MKSNKGDLDIVQWMLRQAPSPDDPPFNSLEQWEPAFRRITGRWSDSMDRSMAGGFTGDRLAWAMASGYQGALGRMWPDLPSSTLAALCVTESGGGHPRAIATRLTTTDEGQWEVTGNKTFITHGDRADTLFVAATTGTGPDDRPRIRMVRIPRTAPGVTLETMPELPFIPEIGHASLHLERVGVAGNQVLAGDGYADCIKPFRTIEDLHVFGAVSGYLAATAARFQWPASHRSGLFAIMGILRTLSAMNPLSPLVHILLDGVFSQLARWIEDTGPHWETVPEPVRTRWRRDRPLLNVAQNARKKRFESALKQMGASGFDAR